jgi:hypothetical protein
VPAESAKPPTSDMHAEATNIRDVPKAAVSSRSKTARLFDHLVGTAANAGVHSREAIEKYSCRAEIRSCEALVKLLEHGAQNLPPFFGMADLCKLVR